MMRKKVCKKSMFRILVVEAIEIELDKSDITKVKHYDIEPENN